MANCLHCKKEIQEHTGRRPKKYCSNNCRQRDHQAKKKAEADKKASADRKEGTLQQTDLILPGNLGTVNSPAGTHEIQQIFKKNDGSVTITLGKATFKEPSFLAIEVEKEARKELRGPIKALAEQITEIAAVIPEKKGEAVKAPQNEFMGHPIPKGMKGIDLTIWKAEIKEKHKL